MNLIVKVASFFDIKNPYLRKTRIFLISVILLCFCGLGITLFAKNQIAQTQQQIAQPYHIKNAVSQSQFNQQLAKNNPYQTQAFKNAVKNNQGEQYANSTQGSDQNRIYTLSLMMNHPQFNQTKPTGKDDNTLQILGDYVTEPYNTNLFAKGLCLTVGNFSWYLNQQLPQDYCLNNLHLGFDWQDATVYSNVPLSNDLQQRINNIYQCCELVTVKPNLKFQVINNGNNNSNNQ